MSLPKIKPIRKNIAPKTKPPVVKNQQPGDMILPQNTQDGAKSRVRISIPGVKTR